MRCGLAAVAVGWRLLTDAAGADGPAAAAKMPTGDEPPPVARTRRAVMLRRCGASVGVTQHIQPRKASRRVWPLIVRSSGCSGDRRFGLPQYLAPMLAQCNHRRCNRVLIGAVGNANLQRIDLDRFEDRSEIGVRRLFECNPDGIRKR